MFFSVIATCPFHLLSAQQSVLDVGVSNNISPGDECMCLKYVSS